MRHAFHLHAGDHSIDLHQYLLPEWRWPHVDEGAWSRSQVVPTHPGSRQHAPPLPRIERLSSAGHRVHIAEQEVSLS